MCVFAGEIERVSNTRIFASAAPRGRQRLVYSMDLVTDRHVAMILPLPVAQGSGEDAVRFVDFSGYEEFFDDLAKFFRSRSMAGGDVASASFEEPTTLQVHQVGDFEASYVPSHRDWERLDARFRLDPALWRELPLYDDYGFAVFQLSPAARPGVQSVHPMALEFVSRAPDDVFFPTVHIHDGRVHEIADFDHDLYCQLPETHRLRAPSDEGDGMGWMHDSDDWTCSYAGARIHVDVARAAGLVEGDAPVLLRRMHGAFPNRDVVV